MVHSRQKPWRKAFETPLQRHVGINPVFGKRTKAGLPVDRRLARDHVVKACAQSVKIAPRALLGPGDVEFLRRIAILHDAQRRHGPVRLRRLLTRGAKVDEDRLAVLRDQDVVGRDVAVQHVVAVDEAHGTQELFGDHGDFAGCRHPALTVDDLLKVQPVDIVDGHVGGAVVFKDLMHGHDVGMHDLGQVACLAHEKLHH